MRHPFQRQLGSRPFRGLFALGCLNVSPAAHAALEATCLPSDSALVCHLRSVLGLLEMLAMVLGALLLLTVLLTIRAFRRKRRKLKPDDLTSEAR